VPEQDEDALPDGVDLGTPKRVCTIRLKLECKAMRVFVRFPGRVVWGSDPTAHSYGCNVSC